jgi:hypothetical protein
LFDAAIHQWKFLGACAPDHLEEARGMVHWAVRLLASVATTCLRPLEDNSHLAMTWLAEPGMLAGVFTNDTPRYRAALRVADLTLHLLDVEGASVASTELQGKSLAEGFEWLGSAILAFSGSPPARPLSPPKHEMPAHPIGTGAPFSIGHPSQFIELSRWFGNADAMLRSLTEQDPRASAVRCWPQRLELSTLVVLDEGVELHRARAVSVGLVPIGDGGPAFQIQPIPSPQAPAPRPLPGGRWVEEPELIALLPAAAIVEPPTAAGQATRVADFLEQGLAEAQRLLTAG